MNSVPELRKDTSTRDELVQTIRGFNDHVGSRLSRKPETPVIIFINGSRLGGKSLLWDEMVLSLLGDNPTQDIKGHNRSLERWVERRSRLTEKPLSVYACNLKGIPNAAYLKKFIEEFGVASHAQIREKLGDVVLLNNTDYPANGNLLPRMLRVPDFSVNLTRSDEGQPLASWDRTVEILQHQNAGPAFSTRDM